MCLEYPRPAHPGEFPTEFEAWKVFDASSGPHHLKGLYYGPHGKVLGGRDGFDRGVWHTADIGPGFHVFPDIANANGYVCLHGEVVIKVLCREALTVGFAKPGEQYPAVTVRQMYIPKIGVTNAKEEK